jgi:epoxyqueuosine reductase
MGLVTAAAVRELAGRCGFELAGVAPALPATDRSWYHDWVADGFAGDMRYLTDCRAAVRDDPRNLLPSAQSIVCVGKLYQTPLAHSTEFDDIERGWISRYAWGDDYHGVMRSRLERLDAMLRETSDAPYKSKICVDTAPLLERSYARLAGLGWIGKNTCLIHEGSGSWYFLGELLVSVPIAPDARCGPPPDRCGTCRRCIDACPTAAIVPAKSPSGFAIDSRLCISYFTIELRGAIPEEHRAPMSRNIFGCDICQDVCPWNRRSPLTSEPAFEARQFAPPLERLAAVTEDEFRTMFRQTPVERARYSGFLRNVAIAMGNSQLAKFRAPLEQLAKSPDPVVAEHAQWGLRRLAKDRAKVSYPGTLLP